MSGGLFGQTGLSGTYAPRQTNSLTGLGDSLTQGNGTGQGTPSDWATNQNFPLGAATYAWTVWLSRGAAVGVGNFGVGGETATQVAARASAVVASGAKTCLVLAGTNDALAAVPLATTAAAYNSILSTLRGGGVEPVFLTVPPNGGSTAVKDAIDLINAYLGTWAQRNKVRLIDIFSVLVNPATRALQTSYDYGDGTHLKAAGAAAAGAAVWAGIADMFSASGHWVAGSNTEKSNLVVNALALTDSNADGIPDNWSAIGTPTGGTATHTLEAVTGWNGSAMAIEQAANTNARQLQQDVNAGGSTFAVGDRVRLAARMKSGGGVGATCRVTFNGASGRTQCTVVDMVAANSGVLGVQEVLVPTGTTSMTFNYFVAAGTGKVWFAQPTIVNLTALGLA